MRWCPWHRQTQNYGSGYLAFQLDFLLIGVRSIPFGEAGFTLAILDENKREDHFDGTKPRASDEIVERKNLASSLLVGWKSNQGWVIN